MKYFLRNLIIVAFVSFVLHYTWEYLQSGIFYIRTSYSPSILSATFGDVIMTIILYSILIFVNRDTNWFMQKWEFTEYSIMLLYALFLSFYIELSAIYTGRWTYSEAMPFFPKTNIGFIPVIQLIVLFPMTFLISRLIIKIKKFK